MALTFFYTPASFYSQRGFLALEEKGIPYRRHIITIHGGENLEPWYMRMQPNGTVPTLKHGDVVIEHSKDIILYLDNIAPTAPKFLPDSSVPGADRVSYFLALMHPIRVDRITFGSGCFRQHTQDCQLPKKMIDEKKVKSNTANSIREFQRLADKYPDLRSQYLAKIEAAKDRRLGDEATFLTALEECDKILGEIEEELASKWEGKLGNLTDADPWLCCDHFTIADIYLATLLHRATFAGQAQRFWGDGKRPHLEAYYARVQQRPSFITACGNANNIYQSMVLPKLKYQIRKALPRVFGITVVMAAIGFGVYVKYHDFPTWWPENLKLNFLKLKWQN